MTTGTICLPKLRAPNTLETIIKIADEKRAS